MEKRETVFDFIASVFMLFGITVVMLMMIALVLGHEVKGSVMFPIGGQGLSMALLIQFFMVSLLIMTLRVLFMTDILIKEASNTLRTIWMLAAILGCMSLFVILFKWFPPRDWRSWGLFLTFYVVSFLISTMVVYWKEKIENKQMAEGLTRVKARYRGYDNDRKH